jgi:hypothetical protein
MDVTQLPVALEVLLSGGLLAVHLLLRIFPDLETVFLLVPGHTMTRPWQVLTAGYCEDALVSLLGGIGVLLAAGRVLARLWGNHELLRFVLLTNAVQAGLTWVCMIVLYILFREEHFLFVSERATRLRVPFEQAARAFPAGCAYLSNRLPETHALPLIAAAPRHIMMIVEPRALASLVAAQARLGGVTGLLGSLSVALFQQRHRLESSEALLPLTDPTAGVAASSTTSAIALPRGVASVAASHAPGLCILWAALVLTLTHSGPPDELLFALNGCFSAWFYLRYYQAAGLVPGAPAGDASSDFDFAMLFPPPVRPPFRLLSNATFAFMSSCGCFPPAGWGESRDPLGMGQGVGGACCFAGGRGSSGCSSLYTATTAPQMGASAAGAAGGRASGIELLATPLPPTPSVTTADPEVAERRRERARALIEARLAAKATSAAATPTDGAAELATPTAGTPQTPGPSTVG